jgi:hypothetical protein
VPDGVNERANHTQPWSQHDLSTHAAAPQQSHSRRVQTFQTFDSSLFTLLADAR